MSTMDFVKGIGVGIVAGGTIGMLMRDNKRSSRRMRSKAARTIGKVVENVADSFGA